MFAFTAERRRRVAQVRQPVRQVRYVPAQRARYAPELFVPVPPYGNLLFLRREPGRRG